MKQTPLEKVPEAWTAIVDNRVSIERDSTMASGSAIVFSSDNSKSYSVKWKDNGSVFTSTDAASFWQGYPGYPVIAVLMIQNRLPYDDELASKFANVEWKEINKKFKNNYSLALEYVCSNRGINLNMVIQASNNIIDQLMNLNITIKRK